jgi:hypothetical protein
MMTTTARPSGPVNRQLSDIGCGARFFEAEHQPRAFRVDLSGDAPVFAVGFIVSFVSALVVVRAFLSYVSHHSFSAFAYSLRAKAAVASFQLSALATGPFAASPNKRIAAANPKRQNTRTPSSLNEFIMLLSYPENRFGTIRL